MKAQLVTASYTAWQVLSAVVGEKVGSFGEYITRLGLIDAPAKPARVPHPKGKRPQP